VKDVKRFHRAEGFTLVELMIVILIIAILVAIAIPIYINATNNAKKRTCQANLRTIDGAISSWKAENGGDDGHTDVGNVQALVTAQYLKALPQCKSGNITYILIGTWGQQSSSCANYAGHSYP
jgi:type IV pilus assembly protein PilA